MENNIHFSRQALADLDDIWDYIAHKINNPIAASRTTEGILHAVEQLEIFSCAGKALFFSNGINSGYRFIVYKNYMVFYHVNDTDIFIDRILYGKRDYMKLLFP